MKIFIKIFTFTDFFTYVRGVCFAIMFILWHSVSAQDTPHKIAGLNAYDAPTYQDLQSVFATNDYHIHPWTGKVPAIAPQGMPQNLIDAPTKTRKKLFIQMMIPLIIESNRHIESHRKTVTALSQAYAKRGTLNGVQKHVLSEIADTYKATGDTAEILQTLQIRVHPVPVGLALAQAIIESGWGTSRFTREGNSLFGQWTYAKDKGLIPQHRDEGKTHTVKFFATPYESVVSYMNNLNSHEAYADLRKIRYNAWINNTPVTAYALSAGLDKYSQLGFEYVKKIRELIRSDKLEQYNTAVIQK